MIRPLRLAPSALAVVAALALAGCGTTSAPATTAPATAGGSTTAAGGATQAATTAPTQAQQGSGDAKEEVLTASKKMSEAKSYRMTMTMTSSTATSGPMTITSEAVKNASGGMDTRTTMGTAAGAMEVISIGNDSYIKLPKAVNGKTWMKSTSTSTTGPAKNGSIDTSSLDKDFGSAQVTKVGTDGDATKYQITGVKDMGTVLMWVGKEGYPTKMTLTTSAGGGDIVFSDWNAAITITAPPADQVASM